MISILNLVVATFLLSTLARSAPKTTVDGLFQECLPQGPPAVYEDCIKIILGFTTGLRPKETATFSRDTWSGVRLPKKGIHGQCVFELDMYNDAIEDVASTLDVTREAGKMAKDCVLKAPRRGGVAWVGRRNGIEIILHGPLTTSRTPNVMAKWQHIGCAGSVNMTSLSASMTGGNKIALEDCAEECAGYKYLGTRFGTQ